MDRPLSSAALLVGLAVSPFAAAAGGTVTDQTVSLTYGVSHWDGAPQADLAGVDATGDPLYESGWFYRAGGDTREYPLPAPDTETYANGHVSAEWYNVDGKNFALLEDTYLFDGEGPSGGFTTTMIVTNHNATTEQFVLIHYLDVDAAGSTVDDSGTLVNPAFVKFSDGAHRVSYRSLAAGHYQVTAYPALRNALNDAAVTDLNDTGLPFGPGDVTAAYQFGPLSLPAGSVHRMGPLSVLFNPARDHVKGDTLGVGLPSLFEQQPDLSSLFVHLMRRTSITWGLSLSKPTATCRLAGADDFQGQFLDDLVFRDTATGVAYVGDLPIGGAPTLPSNWKLSATGDFNADGRADILWRNTTSQKLVIWTMSGHDKIGAIIPSPDQAVDGNWEVAAAADFNGDGNRDLLWYNQTSGKIVLWFMNAAVVRITGQFTNPATVGNNNWRVLAVGDYGKGPGGYYDTQDVVWQNDTSKRVVVWFMDQAANRTGGTFTTPDALPHGWDLVGPR